MEKKTTQLLSQINQKMKVAMLSASSYSWTLMPRSMVSKTLKAPTPVCRYYWAGMSSMWRKRRTKEINKRLRSTGTRALDTYSLQTNKKGRVGQLRVRAKRCNAEFMLLCPHIFRDRRFLTRRWFLTWSRHHRFREHRSFIQMTWRTILPFMTSLGRGHWSHHHRFREHRRGAVSSRWLSVPAFRLWHRLGVAIEKNAMNGEPIRKRYNECSS